ncbi:hypothetical protein INT48_002875 [Thamnidium elegans]|uniref:Uncharacterized protein n=1 Tax=Thamnidium elegans TaxID=101142 RepID=A0A8H7STM2_9FUNG|nr:hypothetical protein INT48_002875 [Thamnidium elegans]
MAPTSVSQNAPSICDTPACHALSKQLLETVNLNVDPCSDFFQYTCGSWLNSEPVKQAESPTSIIQEMEHVSRQKVMEFLTGTFEDLQKDIATDDESFQTHNQTETDKKNFELVRDYYSSCIDNKSRAELGASSMFPLINEIEKSLFPVTDAIDPDNVAKTLAWTVLNDIQSLFVFSINEDINNNGYKVVNFGLPAASSKSDYRPGSEDYRIALVYNLTDVLGPPSPDNADYEKLINEKSQASNFTFWSRDKILEATNNYVLIERQMELILATPYNSDDIFFTLSDLKVNSTTINWDTFFTTLVSEEYTLSNPSVMFTKDYITAIDTLLSSQTPQVLQEYFVIKTVLEKLDSLRFLEPDMFIAPDTKESVIYTPEELCSRETSKNYKYIIWRFFVLKSFGASKEKKQVEDMADLLHQTWMDELPNNTWLDDGTKVKLLEKVKAIEKRIAYSTTSPDIRDPSALTTFYYNVTTNQSYFESTSEIRVHENKRLWSTLGRPVDENAWLDLHYADWVNALFSPLASAIEIPVGMIQEPFYSPNYPQYINYGGLGVTIAHEFMHSVDSTFIIFNGTGQIDVWFSEESMAAFSHKTQCFADQYSQFAILGASNRRLPINGNFTLGENMSDNGGLRIAFDAYQKHIRDNVSDGILPGFENFTREQLFFISHGLFTCATGQKSLNEFALGIDTHAPLYYRNIITYQNSHEFAEAFNCPVGSPMNPSDKCSVW